jgi:two-component system chemotaxis response regulator CheY
MGLNVLVVDDSAVMRSMIIRTLRLSGVPVAQVIDAANGAEGLAALDRHWIDLALVDINMPVLSGEEVIARLRERPETASLPVIVISSGGSVAEIEQLGHPNLEFMQKPFVPEVLGETVRRLTGVTEVTGDGMDGGAGPAPELDGADTGRERTGQGRETSWAEANDSWAEANDSWAVGAHAYRTATPGGAPAGEDNDDWAADADGDDLPPATR